jgi:F-type H+-transporting ATPase subunit a
MAEASHSENPFDPVVLFGHVKDADYFHFPRWFTGAEAHGHAALPQPLMLQEPLVPRMGVLEPLDLKFTKFMVIEVIAAILVAFAFIWLANRVSTGDRPKGGLWNLLEVFLVFIRDQVARPAIGHHDADKFLPFLWTLFFFILGCNLFGMIPWMGSPTGALAVTGTMAIITFLVVIGAGMAKLGPIGFWKAQVPHMDLPPALAIVLKPMIFAIEILGLFIKHFVLAIRLLANMMAGHFVVAVIMGFIAASATSMAFYGVAPASVLGAVAISLLELFVAFLQAYIFTFLAALFIGMAVHEH